MIRVVDCFRMWALNAVGSWTSLQLGKRKKDKWKSSMSLNPRPPKCFGLVLIWQETQMRRHKPWWSLQHGIENIGTACATELIKISLPPKERIFFPFNHEPYSTLFPSDKAPFFELPTLVGIPRYLSGRDSLLASQICLISSCIGWGHPLLNKIEDLSKFIICPDAWQYLCRA